MIDTTQLRINPERLEHNFEALSQIGATVDGGISRLALSNEDLEARAWLADQFEESGFLVYDDEAGNLSGILLSQNQDARTLLLGSHMDSVPNGGRYDCSLGILASLECMRTIQEAGIELPFHLETVNFTDEEGCWQSLFGSRAMTGNLNLNYHNGASMTDLGPFRAALFRAGIRPTDVEKARRDPETLMGYLELHIEQGHRLDQRGIDIGVVTGIIGRTTYELTFYGEASHSGTTSMSSRRDALLGASVFIYDAYDLVQERFPLGVFNCGNINISPGSFNIVPAEAKLTFECRHPSAKHLSEMEAMLIRLAQESAAHYGLTVSSRRMVHMPVAKMSDKAIRATETACQALNISHTRLVSYAGHDAQMMSNFTPTGMIFVPSVDGISHSPKEFTEWQHIVKGANVLLHTILNMA